MTVAEIKEYFEKNKDSKEVKDLIASLSVITPEAVGKFLESDEGFKALRPHFDRYADKAIKTHDEKKREEIEAEVAKKVAELGKKKDLTVAEQIAEIQKKIDAKDSELARERVLRQLEAEAASRKLVLKNVIDIDNPKLTIERGIELLDARKKENEELEAKVKNELLAGGYKPGSGGDKGKKTIDPKTLTLEQAMALEMKGELNAAISTT